MNHEQRVRRYGLLDPHYVILALINFSCLLFQFYRIFTSEGDLRILAYVLAAISLIGCFFVFMIGRERVRLIKIYKEYDELIRSEERIR